MTAFSELMKSMTAVRDNSWSVTINDNWMQGRTTYGGLSAALCLRATQNDNPDLPPLRSAQISFIGPVGDHVTINTRVLRYGKSVAYICAEISGERGLAAHAVFCFGAARKSKINQVFGRAPATPGIAESTDFFTQNPGPVVTQNFDCLLSQGAQPISGAKESEITIWARHKDPAANDLTALISVADIPPPAVLPMFKQRAPISSMTWMMNFLSDHPTTNDRWWLMRSTAEHARDGYSSQDMAVWNTDGDLVITGRQNVAIFY